MSPETPPEEPAEEPAAIVPLVHLDAEGMPVLALAFVADEEPVVVDFASLEQAAVFAQAVASAVGKTYQLQRGFADIDGLEARQEAFALEAQYLYPGAGADD